MGKLREIKPPAMPNADYVLLCGFFEEILECAKDGRIRCVTIQCFGSNGDSRYLIGDDYAEIVTNMLKHMLEVVLPDVADE